MRCVLRDMRRSDDGFTVVEVVVAAFILFFALTALIGLMGASTNMSTAAKGRSIVTNAIAGELETVRAMPFNRLALTTAMPPGDVPPTRTITRDGYTITLTFIITDRVMQNGTKEVTVNAVARRAGVPDIRTSATAYVRNRVGAATVADGDAPTIEFVSPTPDTNTIVSGASLQNNMPLEIAATASSETNSIARIEFMVSGETTFWLRDGNGPGANSSWRDFSGTNPEETFTFRWHTGQMDPSVVDGRRTVRIVAYDDQGRSSVPRDRTFIVDNHPPDVPSNATLTWQGGVVNGLAVQSLNGNWTKAMDGTDLAPFHNAHLFENTNGSTDIMQWPQAGAAITAPGAFPGVNPFGCYHMRVRALSPLQNPGGWSTTGVVYTRPRAYGTSDVTRQWNSNSRDRWTYVSRVHVERPRFPYQTSTLTVEVIKWVGGTAQAPVNVTAAALTEWNANRPYIYTDTDVQTIGTRVDPTVPRYQFRIGVTPIGAQTARQTMLSNFASPWSPSPISTFEYTGSGSNGVITATNRDMGGSW